MGGTRLALRPREAAKALGVSKRTLWDWTKRGLVPHVRIERLVRYPVADLHRWLRESATGSSSSPRTT